jgi:endonuclease YncB( thermonuclease family)
MPRALLATVFACLFCLLGAAGAQAEYSGRCLPGNKGPKCHFWQAKISRYQDGDTIAVHINGIKGEKEIRFAAIQAMEQTVYSNKHPELRRGECHALEATARQEQLIKQSHGLLRLSAQGHPTHDVLGRLVRWVDVKIGGHWQNLGLKLISEGHALWLPLSNENAWNSRYNQASQEAAQKHVNLWNPTYCGNGPSQGVPLKLWVSSDPLGVDTKFVNGEWFKILNESPTQSISLGKWWVRDADHRRYNIPAGTVVAPGETLTVYAGRGTNHGNSLYWGLTAPPFQNPGTSEHLGDGGYLFDPQGDLRASMVYPCMVACTNPDQGAIRVIAHPERPEYADFVNVSTHPVDLYGYAMWIQGSSYPIGGDSVLQPGERMRIYISGNPSNNTHSTRYWGVPKYMLPDSGGWLKLQTYDYITLGCDAWGSGHC